MPAYEILTRDGAVVDSAPSYRSAERLLDYLLRSTHVPHVIRAITQEVSK